MGAAAGAESDEQPTSDGAGTAGDEARVAGEGSGTAG